LYFPTKGEFKVRGEWRRDDIATLTRLDECNLAILKLPSIGDLSAIGRLPKISLCPVILRDGYCIETQQKNESD
jgi:hypothetical protein